MQFSDFNLNPRLLINMHKHGFINATEVQAQSIPMALTHKDLLVSADTGSGKTLAFLVPCVQHLLSNEHPNPSTRCLILAPTRELAHQILALTNRLIKGTRLQTALLLGGEDYHFQAALLRKNPAIIIATPGRFMEHQRKGHTDTSGLEILVVDEADRMLALGFVEDVVTIAKAANAQRQTLFYSATLRNEKVIALSTQLLQQPLAITLNDASQVQDNIQQQVVLCDDIAHKQRVLLWLLANQTANKRLIFVNSRQLSEDLATLLQSHGHSALALHGELPQDDRNTITKQFRQHRNDLLIATEVAARGLDITQIDQVINFDMARNLDDYLHRVGRTGRAGSMGQAINLINLSERQLLLQLESAQGKPIARLKIKGLAAKKHQDNTPKPSGVSAGKSSSKKNTAKKAGKTINKKSNKTKTANNTKATDKLKTNKQEDRQQDRQIGKSSQAAKQRAKTLWGDGSAPMIRKK